MLIGLKFNWKMRRLNAHPRSPLSPPTGRPRPDSDFNGMIQAKPEALFINCEESRKGTTQFLSHPVCLANFAAWIPSLPALQWARKIPPLATTCTRILPSCSDPQTAVVSLCIELMYLSILQDTQPHTWLVLPKRYKPNCQRCTVAQAPDQEWTLLGSSSAGCVMWCHVPGKRAARVEIPSLASEVAIAQLHHTQNNQDSAFAFSPRSC